MSAHDAVRESRHHDPVAEARPQDTAADSQALRSRAGALGYEEGRELLAPAPAPTPTDGPPVQFWKGSGHKALTRPEVPAKYLDVNEVCEASTKMDGKRSGTDANHGEGGLYKESLRGSAAGINAARQLHWLMESGRYAKEYFRLKGLADRPDNDNAGAQAELKKRGDFQRDCMVNRLGDALHVAQDRGAHGEGVPGKGHDWKLISLKKPFWKRNDCDEPGKNPEGYKEAQFNSRSVMTSFLAAYGPDLAKHPANRKTATW